MLLCTCCILFGSFAPKPFDMKIYNPFTDRNPKEVWDEIRRNKKPISKEEALKQMRNSKKQS